MFSDVNAFLAFLFVLLSWIEGGISEGWWLRCPAGASVSRQSGTAQAPTAANWAKAQSTFPFESLIIALLCSSACLSCTGKKLRPALLRKGCLAARASSCNPRTTLSQSEAQPEPLTTCAPNSNRCQSGGYHRQLVFVR